MLPCPQCHRHKGLSMPEATTCQLHVSASEKRLHVRHSSLNPKLWKEHGLSVATIGCHPWQAHLHDRFIHLLFFQISFFLRQFPGSLSPPAGMHHFGVTVERCLFGSWFNTRPSWWTEVRSETILLYPVILRLQLLQIIELHLLSTKKLFYMLWSDQTL